MIRLSISVEGKTEQEFVKSVLVEHLKPRDVAPTPILLGRARRARDGSGGGSVSIEKLASDMAHLCHSFDAVTSLVDFYGFRNKGDKTTENLEGQLKQAIEKKIHRNLDSKKIIPYIQKYEFEGLLFSNVAAFGDAINASGRSVEELGKIRSSFSSPEDINDHPNTAPSKRIAGALPGYRKRLHGPLVAREIGIETIRKECERFHDWIRSLEALRPLPSGSRLQENP